MGRRNVLVEGVSCAGKTTLAIELERRGVHVVHGDRALAYQGDPVTGEQTATADHAHHVWDLERVQALAADDTQPLTVFCGGARNHARFRHLMDVVVVLEIDRATLEQRLDERPHDEFGARPHERALVLRLHETREDLPPGVLIDATRPVAEVADAVLRLGLG